MLIQMQKFKSSNNSSTLRILFFLYISFASITSLWQLGFLGAKLQASEFIFLLILPFSLPLLQDIRLSSMDFLLIGYIFLFFLNLLFHPELNVFLEVIGVLYLFILYFILSRFLATLSNNNSFIEQAFLSMLVVACVTAILGYLFFVFEISTKFIMSYKSYPYFGDVIRWKGFSASPNLLTSNICIALFILQISTVKSYWKWLITLFALGIGFMTLSKQLSR